MCDEGFHKIRHVLLTSLNNRSLSAMGQTTFYMFCKPGTLMRRYFSAVCVAALMIGAAEAQDSGDYVPPEQNYDVPDIADVSAPAPETQAAPVVETSSGGGWDYDWGGSYLGVSAALAMGAHDTVGVGGISASGDDLKGYGLGGHLGHNYQFSRIVVGTEMDFSKTEIEGDFELPGSLIACDAAGFECGTTINWLGSFRGRAGIAINSFMPYITAGVAVGGIESNFRGAGLDQSISGLGLGWVAGGGVEYAVMKHLTVRAEALHYDLSDVSDAILGTDVSTDPSVTVVRAGATLKF
jgi:outer membrane immunogenic protein